MAYDPKNLSLIVAGGVAGGGIKFYSYKTTVDNLAAVLAAGYFARAEDAGLKEQDIVFVVLSDDSIVTLTVTGFTAAGAAIVEETIEDGLDGLFSNTYVAKTTTASIINADKGKTISLAGNACYTLTYGAASTYDDNFGNIVINSDAGRAKFISLNGVVHKLWPGQRATILNVNDAWKIEKPDRWKLTAETIFYADAVSGVNDTNDGLAAGSGGAWASPMHLYTHIVENIDVGGDFNLILQLADGTYTIGLHLAAPLIGRDGGQNFLIRGENTTGALIRPATGSAVGIFTGQSVYLENMRLEAPGGSCLDSAQGGNMLYISNNVVFGDCAGNHINIGDAHCLVVQPYTIDGNAANHYAAGARGLISGQSKTVTVAKNVTFSQAFANASVGGIVAVTGFTFSLGAFSVSGPRFTLATGGIIAPGTTDVNYFPGSIAGINNGGQYGNSYGAHTWTEQQTFSDSSGFPVFYIFTDDGATGPQTVSQHISASPAANDVIFGHLMQAKDSGGTTLTYARWRALISSPTDAAEAGLFDISTVSGGTLTVRHTTGAGLYMAGATGGDKGAGTINATAVYDDNVLLTDLVLDMAVTGSFDVARYASHPVAGEMAPWWFDLDAYAAAWRDKRSLPGMRSWADEADKPSSGEMITRLTAVVENQAVLIEVLNQRLKALEA